MVNDSEYVPAAYGPIPTGSICYTLKFPLLPIPHEWINEIFFCPCFLTGKTTTKVTTWRNQRQKKTGKIANVHGITNLLSNAIKSN